MKFTSKHVHFLKWLNHARPARIHVSQTSNNKPLLAISAVPQTDIAEAWSVISL